MRRFWWLVVAVGLLAGLAGLGVWCYRSEMRPLSTTGEGVAFRITPGEKTKQIAADLTQKHLVRSKAFFLFYLDLHNLRSHLQTGDYNLKASYSTPEIADILAGGKIATGKLIVPEGYTLAQIRQLAITKGIKAGDFDQALVATYPEAFLAGRPTTSLEGYLFPDTYDVNSTTSAQTLIGRMLADFDQRVTPDLRQQFKTEGLTLDQGITLASMVEKEVSNPTDQPIVAGIFMKRLKAGQPLESDATVIYASNLAKTSFDLNIDSPYNTYQHTGLPVGPIASPGLAAIRAAASPAPTDYLYFIADKTGVIHYAKTFAEHQANVAKYLQ